MDEQKPAKAHWWSRPSTPGQPGASGVARASSGPDAVQGTAPQEHASGDDGDYTLQAAAPSAADPQAADPQASDPQAPAPVAGPQSTGSVSSAAVPTGYEGRGPAADSAVVGEPKSGAAHAAAGGSRSAEERQGGTEEFVVPLDAVPDKPRPLHEPDPYSTPPYGEPGPWAPAPPVQHPVGAPGEGAAQPTVHATAGVPQTPVSEQPVPPAPAVSTPARPPRAGPTHSAPAPGPYGTAAQAPQTTTAVPGRSGTPGQPSHAGQPTPAGAVPPQAAPAGPAPGPAPAPPAPQPPASVHWQQYDPWAAPLQQTGAAAESVRQRKRRVRRSLVGGALALTLVSGVTGGVVGTYLERNGGLAGGIELDQQSSDGAGERDPDSVAGIAERSLPGVVTLHVNGSDGAGTGTGFVLDSRGHILTNNHVVAPAGDGGSITVTFSSGQTARGTVIGGDNGYDLAVVKVTGVKGLKPLPLGNSDDVRVGDPVVAIGAPFDLANTVTSGIISAKERPITAGGEKGDGSDISYVDALQTDAPINPGNSGGPLMDSGARVIGINSAIRSAGGGNSGSEGQAGSIGLGFAIPVNQGKRVAEELIDTGKATHPVIGVTLDMEFSGDGARVGAGAGGGSPVSKGGPAEKAGIRARDVITAVDGQRVHSGEELIVKVRAHRPGDRLRLTVRSGADEGGSGGKEREVSLVLGEAGGE